MNNHPVWPTARPKAKQEDNKPFPTGEEPPNEVPGKWTRVFTEEFLEPSLDLSKWSPNWMGNNDTDITTPYDIMSERQYYSPKQLSIYDSELIIDIKQSPVILTLTSPEHSYPIRKAYTWASGIIHSFGKFHVESGSCVEAKIWTPGQVGTHPIFKLMGERFPIDGSIEIMNQTSNTDPVYGYHYDAGFGHDPYFNGSEPVFGGASGGWHTYAVNWASRGITWYYDGRKVGEVFNRHLKNKALITSSPQIIVLTLSTERIKHVVLPAKMRVDYVRVWKS